MQVTQVRCFQRFIFEWQCWFPPCRLCKSNQWIKVLTLSLCVIPNHHFTHVLFSEYSSLSQAISNQTKSTNVPRCRLCKSNQWIKVLTLTLCVIPNQIILHTYYFHSIAPCLKQSQTKPNVPPCRLCKLNDSIDIFYVAIPNQIILQTSYSLHCNQII